MLRALPWLLSGAILAVGCSKEVDGRPFGPDLGTDSTTAAGVETDGDQLTTSISASDGTAPGGSSTSDPATAGSGDGSTGAVDPSAGTSEEPTTGESSDASTGSGGDSAGGDGGGSTGGPGAALDPLLDIAEEGEICSTPGHLGECPGVATVCRFHDSQSGRCESCDSCGNLNAFCSDGTDCDILFACFAGRCTNFCTLGTQECGAPDDCLDVGHPTRGVCDPSSI